MLRHNKLTIARMLLGLTVAAPACILMLPWSTTSSVGAGLPASGTLVFARGAEAGGGLYTIGSTGRGMRRVTSGSDEAPAWSPDGTRLVFSRTRNRGQSYEIYLVTAGGRHLQAITPRGGFAQSPSWSPDGARIIFSASGGRFGQSGDRSCEPSLWVVRSDGSGLRRLVATGVEPAYSPDGRWIAFVRTDARDRPWLYLVDSSGHRVRRLGAGAHPSWSPDGKQIVVERGVGLNRIADLWVLRARDGLAKRLTSTPTLSEQGPAWSPDGRWIAFSMVAGGRQDIYVIPATGGRPHAVTHTGTNGGNFEPAWEPPRAAASQPVER